MKQQQFFKKESKAYGGELFKTRKGRSRGRPLDTKNSMHMVLRSSQAIGQLGFRYKDNAAKIKSIIDRFSMKYGIKIYSFANVGNHLHIHMHLRNRGSYRPFIRAITAAIMMAVTGASRWKKAILKTKFWDLRPYTRVIIGRNAIFKIRHYIAINKLQGLGHSRESARFYVGCEFGLSHTAKRGSG